MAKMTYFDDTMKVKRMPVKEQVFESMKDAIRTRKWQVGEKIPSETELAAMFNVNRLTVRTAMQRLIGMGLLESRVGDGTYVTEFSLGNYLAQASEFYLGPEMLDQVYEFRQMIEVEASRLAILRATEDELDELDELCNTFEVMKGLYLQEPSEKFFDEIVKTDMAFHKKLIELAHNELFSYAFVMAQDLFRQYVGIVLTDRLEHWEEKKRKGEPWNDLHRVVCAAIRARDFEACKKAHLGIIDYKIKL